MVKFRSPFLGIRLEMIHNKPWCKGCGYCKEVCMRNAWKMVEDSTKVSKQRSEFIGEKKCVGCGYCELICPDQAIAVIGCWGLNIPRGLVSGEESKK